MSVWLSPEGLELTLHFGPSQIPLSQEALGQETHLGVQSQETPGSKPTVATTAAKQQGSHRVKAAGGLSGVIAECPKAGMGVPAVEVMWLLPASHSWPKESPDPRRRRERVVLLERMKNNTKNRRAGWQTVG